MKFVKDNISWIAPTAAIVLVATGFLDRDNGLRFFSGGETEEATTTQPVTQLNATVEAAMASQTGETQTAKTQAGAEAGLNGQEVAAMLESTWETDDPMEVSRNAPVDLLSTAPAVVPKPLPEGVPVAFDGDSAADFFASAQANLAAESSCKEDLSELAAAAKVYFPSGALSGEEAGLSAARLIGMVARECPGFTIQVEGHSDPSGDPAINLTLSKKRAEAVISRLGASGMDTSNFVAVGYGDTRPSNIRGTKPSGYYDRRVEFSVVETTRQAVVDTEIKPWQAAPVADCVRVLERKAEQARHYYAPRSITAPVADMEAVFNLATEVAQCDGARLRVVGHHSDQPGSRENAATGRLRALAMMSSLVTAGFAKEQILIGAPSYSVSVAGQPGLPNSRVDFQVIAD